MNALEPFRHSIPSSDAASPSDDAGYALNIAGLYQDSLTRSWAIRTCRNATNWAGEEHIHHIWHDVSALTDPGILSIAVRAALAADVIVVSVYAADELPSELCAWAASWSPHRRSRMGALTALVGVDEPLEGRSVRTIEYLETVAREARLDFFPTTCKRPRAASAGLAAAQACRDALAAEKLRSCYYDPYNHWGLNE